MVGQVETRKERRARERKEQKLERKNPTPAKPVVENRGKKPLFPWLLMAFCLGVGATLLIFKAQSPKDQEKEIVGKKNTIPTKQTLKGKGFSFVLNLSPEEVDKYDMAELNLLCGSGLDGNEKGDLDQCMKIFDELVEMVRAETQRNWGRWQSNPAEYQNSEAYYRMGMLITVVRQDFGTKYNPKLITDPSKKVDNDGKLTEKDCPPFRIRMVGYSWGGWSSLILTKKLASIAEKPNEHYKIALGTLDPVKTLRGAGGIAAGGLPPYVVKAFNAYQRNGMRVKKGFNWLLKNKFRGEQVAGAVNINATNAKLPDWIIKDKNGNPTQQLVDHATIAWSAGGGRSVYAQWVLDSVKQVNLE